MASPRKPHTSVILILITALSCGAAWLLADNTFIPAVDTGFALTSVGALIWGLVTIYREEATARPVRSALIRNSRKLIHSLWAVVALLLNAVVVMFWYYSLPDYIGKHNGRQYYAYQKPNPIGADENLVDVWVKSGIREIHVGRMMLDWSCRDKACFQVAVEQVTRQKINKKQ